MDADVVNKEVQRYTEKDLAMVRWQEQMNGQLLAMTANMTALAGTVRDIKVSQDTMSREMREGRESTAKDLAMTRESFQDKISALDRKTIEKVDEALVEVRNTIKPIELYQAKTIGAIVAVNFLAAIVVSVAVRLVFK